MAGEGNSDQRFIAEAREHLAAMTAALIALERGESDPVPHVEQLLRSSHSIKGGAGFTGRRSIEQLAHAVESAVENIRDRRVPASAESIDALLSALDRVGAMVDDVEHSDSFDIQVPLQRLKPLVDPPDHPSPSQHPALQVQVPAVSSADAGEFPISDRVRANWPEGDGYLYGVKLDWYACQRDAHLDATDVADRLASAGTILDSRTDAAGPSLRVGLPEPPLWFRAIIASPLEPEAFASRLGIACAGILRLHKVTSGLEPTPAVTVEPSAKRTTPTTSLRVSVPLIDRMMELAAELSLVRNEALRSSDPADVSGRRLLRRLDSVTTDLQEAALRMRMQPVGGLFDRARRLVRDLARQLGKQIDLHISGSEVELDKTILEILSDPLTHLIRNCCDHGIETPEARLRAAKPPCGSITLSARQERGQIVIEIRDDGKGIDPDVIRRKAIEQGIRTRQELESISDRQLYDLILLSGFSTASRVTDLSGRGVGMDVVKTNLEQIGGSVEIDSTIGRGTRFTLRLPLTLAIMPCLLVSVDGQPYAIPQRELEELAIVDSSDRHSRIECTQDEEVLRLRGDLVPVLRLSEVLASREPFDMQRRIAIVAHYHGAGAPNRRQYVAVMRVGSVRFGLVVDDVLESEDIVVKPLHPLLRQLGVFGAATLLGDGSVALILSGEGIARHGGIMHRPATSEVHAPAATEATGESLLLFRSGPAELLALPLAAVQRVVMFQAGTIQRVGRQELVQIGSTAVNIVRLDHLLSLSPCPEADQLFLILPHQSRGQVGIVASSIVDTSAATSRIDEQPYPIEGVLGTSLIQDKIALVLDVDRLLDLSRRADQGIVVAQPTGGSQRVLLVEDTHFFQQLITSLLEKEGFQVTLAQNGRDAIEKLAAESFDIVVSDIEMPEMDGCTLARRVREDPRLVGLPMLAVTTLSGPEHRDRALAAGFDAFEVKLDQAHFVSTVRALLLHTRDTAMNAGSADT